MKIGIFCFYFPKITETFILNRITRLIDNGFEVKIYAYKNPAIIKAIEDSVPETMVQPDVIKYNLEKKVAYFPKDEQGSRDYSEIFKTLQKDKIDLLHIQWGELGEELLGNLNFPFPVFVSFHSFRTPNLWVSVKKTYESVFRKADLILPITNYVKEGLIKKGCPSKKIKIHHMGVDALKFCPPPSKVIHKDVRILSVGSFIEKKGFHEALEALNYLGKSGVVNFHYYLVGDGILKSRFEELIQKYSLKDKVTFLGKMIEDKLIEEYQKADILIHPSLLTTGGEDEGLPVVLMEASACGLPIISTFHAGIPELVINNESGFLAPEHQPKELAEHLKKLIANPKLCKKMGLWGREIVKKEFNVDKLNQKMMGLYNFYVTRGQK